MSLNKKESNKILAEKNEEIFQKGFYELDSGKSISIREALDFCKRSSREFLPEELKKIASNQNRPRFPEPTKVDVLSQSTFEAALSLRKESSGKVIVLNFASATTPGGGYLKGSQAQEEHLCRTSTLYPCLAGFPEFYNFHRQLNSFLYSDRMIYSPDVLVFRDDEFQFLSEPYPVSVITSAAPVLIGREDSDSMQKSEQVMDQRIFHLLNLIIYLGYENLVLGAWGCGAFKNDPNTIAGLFKKHCLENKFISHSFRKIRFGIIDPKNDGNKIIFERVLGI